MKKRALPALALLLSLLASIAFAEEPSLLRGREAPTVLTPHPGEAAALLGGEARDLNADRPAAARALAAETDCVVVLKGAGTIVASPGGALAVNATGGPALATGGTGDVLLGMTVGLLAQGLAAAEAASLAVHLHGLAADRWAARRGETGLLAGDLAGALPETLQALRDTPTGDGSDRSLVVGFPEP